jgi:hypothetical protein
MHKLNMKHEKHPWFIRDSNPVTLGQKSGALTTELPGHLNFSHILYTIRIIIIIMTMMTILDPFFSFTAPGGDEEVGHMFYSNGI